MNRVPIYGAHLKYFNQVSLRAVTYLLLTQAIQQYANVRYQRSYMPLVVLICGVANGPGKQVAPFSCPTMSAGIPTDWKKRAEPVALNEMTLLLRLRLPNRC